MKNRFPAIKVKLNKERDKELFLDFIRQGGMYRKRISKSYPELKKAIKDSKDAEKPISDFIDQLYSRYQSQLNRIVERETEVLKNANKAIFSGLEEVMGCDWDSSFEFSAIPTFLSFSPFGKRCFYFSIYNEVIGGKEGGRRLDRIAIHELSHICWYQKLERAYKELDFELNYAANYYLKEAFAVIVGESEEFSEINKGYSPPNKNVALLRVKANGKEMEFVDFFRKLFKKERERGLDFDAILKDILKSGYGIQDELDKKWSLWNKHGDDSDKLRERGYQFPIIHR